MADVSASVGRAIAKRRFRLGWVTAGVVFLILAFNLTVMAPVAAALSQDERNNGVGLFAYRTWAGLQPTNLTIDLVTVAGDKAPIDLFRALFEAAAALKDRHFGTVMIARHGVGVFTMSGDAFQALGANYAAEDNPVFLIRTLPQDLRRPDGTEAFPTWEGGLIGVLDHQMEDVNEFARDWIGGGS